MSRFLFVQGIYDIYEGTSLLAAVLRGGGHEVDLIIESSPRRVARHAERTQPNVVAFPCMTGQHRLVRIIAAEIKRSLPAVRTLVGGVHPTHYPHLIDDPAIDFICRGEGEGAILDFANQCHDDAALRRLENISYHDGAREVHNPLRPLIDDLDSLPFPDRDLYYARYPLLRDNPHKHFIASRGCPNLCAFCHNRSSRRLYKGKGRYLRSKSPDYYLEEIRETRDWFGIESVRFEDDDLIRDPAWIEEFLPRFRSELGLPFSCYIRIDNLTDDIARLLHENGCEYLGFSIESGDDRIRNDVLRKALTGEEIDRGVDLLRRHQIPFGTANMLGLPGERIDDAWKTVHLNQRHQPIYAWCSVFQPYPSTELGESLIEAGAVKQSYVEEMPLLYHSQSVLKQNDIQQLLRLHSLFDLVSRYPSLESIARKLIRLPLDLPLKAAYHLLFLRYYVGIAGNPLPFTLVHLAKILKAQHVVRRSASTKR